MAVNNQSVLQLKQIHKIYLIKQLNVKNMAQVFQTFS